MVSRLLTPDAPLCPVVLCQPTQRVGLVEARQNKNSCSPGAVVPSAPGCQSCTVWRTSHEPLT